MIPSVAIGQTRKSFSKVAVDSSINLQHTYSSKECIKYENHIPLSSVPSFQPRKLSLMNAAASGTSAPLAPLNNGAARPACHYNVGG